MTECCANCKHCLKMYVPPLKKYENLPDKAYVCNLFDDQVMYLGIEIYNQCECFEPVAKDITDELEGQTSIEDVFDSNGFLKG